MVSLPAVGPGVGLVTGTPRDFLHEKGFSQKELAQTAMPVHLSWQMAVMDTVVQNKLVPHMDRFKVEPSPIPHGQPSCCSQGWLSHSAWRQLCLQGFPVNIITPIQVSKGFSHFQDWILNCSWEYFGIWGLNFSLMGLRECTSLIKKLNELTVKKEHHFQKLI